MFLQTIQYIITEYAYHTIIFLVLLSCAYFILKPIIIRLINNKCTYTLTYLIVSVVTCSTVLIGIFISDTNISSHERLNILGALWLSIIAIGLITLITYIAKSLSQQVKHQKVPKS